MTRVTAGGRKSHHPAAMSASSSVAAPESRRARGLHRVRAATADAPRPGLSLVDEVDIAGRSADFLDRHGNYFRRSTTAWAPVLSPAVPADARHVFG
jgi:hypothetical protein